MIKIYPSRLDGEPLEKHKTKSRQSIYEWLNDNVKGFSLDVDQPITIILNGDIIDPNDWSLTFFNPSDSLDIYIEPKGSALAIVVISIVAAVVTAVAVSMMMQKTPSSTSRKDGKKIGDAGSLSNQTRNGEPIPEISGSPLSFPDFITPPWKKYTGKRKQWSYSLLCLGMGSFKKNLDDIWVGDTRLVDLGSNADAAFYEPNELIPKERRAWWHSPEEVGFTTFGGSGMTLHGASADAGDRSWVEPKIVNSDYLTGGSGSPTNIQDGSILQVQIGDYVNIGRNWVESDLLDILDAEVGDYINIDSAELDGLDDYAIASIINPSPPVAGSPAILITENNLGSSFDFTNKVVTFDIKFNGVTASIDLSGATYSGVNRLINDINVLLLPSSISVKADTYNGKMRFKSVSPYVSRDISLSNLSGDAVDLLGVIYDKTTGVATQEAIENKRYIIGESELPAGNNQLVSIGINGFRYITYGAGGVNTRIGPINKANKTRNISQNSYGVSSAKVEPPANGTWSGPFTAVPVGELADQFEVDIFMPQGMIRYTKEGKERWISSGVQIQWREVGTTTWSKQSNSIGDKTPNQIGYTYNIKLPRPMRVEVRCRGYATGSKGSTAGPNSDNKVSNTRQWSELRARIVGEPERYPGMTLLYVALRSGDKMAGAAENKIKVRATRRLPTVNDKNVIEPTRDVMPFFLHIVESIGYGRELIDMNAVREQHDILVDRADTFDLAVTTESTAKTMINHCLGVSFGELTIRRGLITPIRDVYPVDPISRVYTEQDYTKPLIETTSVPHFDEIDGVEVEYLDYETGTKKSQTYMLQNDEGRRIEKINAPGVTNDVRAWRLAARHRNMQAYGRTFFKAQTELQALTSHYLDYIGLQDGIPEYGQSALVVAVDGNWLTLSEEIGDEFLNRLALRRKDGKLSRQSSILSRDGFNVLVNDLEFVPDIGTVVIFSGTISIMHGAQITSVTPSSEKVSFEARLFDARIYSEDDNSFKFKKHYSKEYENYLAGTTHYQFPSPESVGVGFSFVGLAKRSLVHDYDMQESLNVGFSVKSIGKRSLVATIENEESLDVGFSLKSIGKRSLIKYIDGAENTLEKLDVGFSLKSISKRKLVFEPESEPEELDIGFSIKSISKRLL